LSIWLNRFFRFSLVHYLKNTVRGKEYIDKYENDIIGYCIQQDKKYAGIICGHIHSGNIRQFGKVMYMCCGDWCDSCSAITEKNGVYCLEKY
jgi:UDP-2,3-diacylglucosamine pyrophosphatase LpxH